MRILRIVSLFALTLVFAHSGEIAWLTNYDDALAQAKKENKPLLMDFTGSDWCPPCIVMEKKVYASPVFQEYAARNLVLLKVDFPLRTPLPPEVQKQNDDLAIKFHAEDKRPTVILLDSSGREITREFGVIEKADPERFVGWVSSMVKS